MISPHDAHVAEPASRRSEDPGRGRPEVAHGGLGVDRSDRIRVARQAARILERGASHEVGHGALGVELGEREERVGLVAGRGRFELLLVPILHGRERPRERAHGRRRPEPGRALPELARAERVARPAEAAVERPGEPLHRADASRVRGGSQAGTAGRRLGDPVRRREDQPFPALVEIDAGRPGDPRRKFVRRERSRPAVVVERERDAIEVASEGAPGVDTRKRESSRVQHLAGHEHDAAVRRRRERLELFRALERRKESTRRPVPELDRPVPGSRDELPPIGREGTRHDLFRVPLDRAHEPARRPVPELEDVARCRQHSLSVGRERARRRPGPLEAARAAGRSIPEHEVRRRRRHDRLPVGGERAGDHASARVLERAHEPTRRPFMETERLVLRGREDRLAVRGEGARPHGLGRALERPHEPARRSVPELERPVLRRRQDLAAPG